jgi:hypothetical protein
MPKDIMEAVRRHADAVTEALEAHIRGADLPLYRPLPKKPSGILDLSAHVDDALLVVRTIRALDRNVPVRPNRPPRSTTNTRRPSQRRLGSLTERSRLGASSG